MSEQIGKHKGAVETLLHEKKELSRILQIVNSQLQRHLSALDEAGVDTDEFINQVQQQGKNENNQVQKRRQKESSKQERKNKSDQGEKKERSRTSKESSEEDDTDELLEGGNDVGNRDFNPNR